MAVESLINNKEKSRYGYRTVKNKRALSLQGKHPMYERKHHYYYITWVALENRRVL
jgi:hypothetical protein